MSTRVQQLTDVEGCALGVIWQRGACTAYEVRMEFAVSPTPRWSASTGSIYPAIQRLLKRRLVSAEIEDWGPRSKTRFAITSRGLAELRHWVGPPFAPSLGGPAFDPLRTRSCFLGVMDRPTRVKFVQQALRDTREALADLQSRVDVRPAGADFEALASRGSILELEARLRWLEELRHALGQRAPLDPPVATSFRRRAAGRAITAMLSVLLSSLSIAFFAGCSQLTTASVPVQTDATVRSRAMIIPRADHHVHLLGPDALPAPQPELPVVELPSELDRLLHDRAAIYANAKKPGDLAGIFTLDAQALSWRRPSKWVRGEAAIMEVVNGVLPQGYRYVPNAYDITGSSGFIAGFVAVVAGEVPHPALDFLLGLKKGSDGLWRIAAEATTIKSASRFPRIATAEELIRDLNDAGIQRAIVLSDAFWLGSRFPDPAEEMTREYDAVRGENDWTVEQVAPHSERLVMACSAHILRAYAIQELERCATIPQARAFKLHFGDADVNLTKADHLEKVRRFFKAANDLRVPIIVHFSPRHDFDAAYVELFLADVMSQAPDIFVQIAHLGGDGPGLTSPQGTAAFAAVMESGDPRTRNLYFDFAGLVTRSMTAEQAAIMATRMRQMGLKRILYGSDATPGGHANPVTADHLIQTRSKLPLTNEELRTIAENAAPYLR